MSRSRRHNPIHGTTTSESEKKDKRLANRKFRAITKDLLRHPEKDFDDVVFPGHLNEVSEIWSFDKDGKTRIDKDSPYYERMMRK